MFLCVPLVSFVKSDRMLANSLKWIKRNLKLLSTILYEGGLLSIQFRILIQSLHLLILCLFSTLDSCTLPAQNEDIVDLKDGLLSNRVLTVKFPVGAFNISSNTKNTELYYSASSWPELNYIYFLFMKKFNFFLYKEVILSLPCNTSLCSLFGQPIPL